MAIRDGDGYIKLIDRKKNMIISGGENIYPSEVEAVLGACPKVKDVAVIGVPDPKWGERVHGVVVLRDGVEATEAELIDWCRDRIAAFKRPRSISFLARGGDAAHRDGQGPAPGAEDASSTPRPTIPARRMSAEAEAGPEANDLNGDPQSCAAWIARFLKARGIDRIFGLQGGHIQPIWDHVARLGIRIVDVPPRGRGGAHGARAFRADGDARRRDGDGRSGGDEHRDGDRQRLAGADPGAA